MIARDYGSARAGLRSWLIQRVSAIYVAGFALFVAFRLIAMPIEGYTDWRAWMGGGAMRLATAVFFLALFAHAWVGLRSVWMDYLPTGRWRFIASMLSGLGLIALAFWAANIVLGRFPT